MRIRYRLTVLLILSAFVSLVACGQPTGEEASPAVEEPTPATGETPIEAAPPASGEEETPVPDTTDGEATPEATPDPFVGEGPWAVTFETNDGIILAGTLFGRGPVDVVLAPMYPGGQEGWLPFAEAAAEQGYRVLSFDLRGHGESEGEADWEAAVSDLEAALAFLDEHGGERFILIGAGQGGLAAIRVAAEREDVIGLAVISSPRAFEALAVSDADLERLGMPSLWLGARNDMTQSVEELYDQAGSSDKELWIYEGSSLHGTYIFEGADGPDLQRRLLDFLARVTGRDEDA